MNNLFRMLFVSVVALGLIACNNEPTPDNNDDVQQLATPDVGYQVEGNIVMLTWDSVEGAIYYNVKVDDAEAVRVTETAYVVRGLSWNTTHNISVVAVSHDEAYVLSSEPAVVTITLGGRIAPAYREWYPKNNAAATAISNNGRYVVGSYDKGAFILDLETDELIEITGADLYDVTDDGLAVGASFESDPMNGVAAFFRGDQRTEIDLSAMISSPTDFGGASLEAVTPDGTMAVGWFWDYANSGDTEYTQTFGMMVPIAYDFATGTVSVLPDGERKYPNDQIGVVPKGIAPDGAILGYDYSYDMFSVVWSSASEPFEYCYLDLDDKGLPAKSIGDSQNRLSPNGRYVYGKVKTYNNNIATESAGAYDRETGELLVCWGASITAMSDNGIAFINDAPYYMGETSYVIDVNSGDLETYTPIADWLLEDYDLDLAESIPYGVIITAVSQDGNTLVGIANTDMGWVTCVICLDGVMEE